MALYATNRFPGDGSTTSYEFNFVGKYIARTHVKVYQEDNATKVRTSVPINDSNFLNDTTLRSLPVTPVGSTLVIYRDTPKPPLVDFVNGSRFTEYNLDLVARQGLFVAMEAMDAVSYESLGDSLQQLHDLHQAWEESIAAAAEAVTANNATQDAKAQVLSHAADVAIKWAAVTSMHIEVEDAYAEIMATRPLVLADRLAAQVAASWALTYKTIAENSATAAAQSATDAGAAAATAESIRDALAGGSIGFTNTTYDWGSITDTQTFFNQNYGLITEPT